MEFELYVIILGILIMLVGVLAVIIQLLGSP